MLRIGVQTKNVIEDDHPEDGYALLKASGFSCVDFSLNGYLLNTALYQSEVNSFFDQTMQELEQFFAPHKKGAKSAGITINQMHMPYPNYVPKGSKELNDYLWNVVAPKSMEICAFMGCPYIVVHGFKLAYYLGSERKEWERTEAFLDSLAPIAKELGITICIENLYEGIGGILWRVLAVMQGKQSSALIDLMINIMKRYWASVLIRVMPIWWGLILNVLLQCWIIG